MELLPYFEQAPTIYFNQFQINGKRRTGIRKFVLYANGPLPTIADRLAFLLSYLKLNPLQELQADLFHMQQKQCYEFVHSLKIMLDHALQLACVLPAQTDKELQQVLAATEPDAAADTTANQSNPVLLHDGTEREVPRTTDSGEQQEKYSSKKKKHTVKNAVVINALCYVLFTSLTFNGKVPDKKRADQSYTIPAGYAIWQDCGYQGYQPQGVTAGLLHSTLCTRLRPVYRRYLSAESRDGTKKDASFPSNSSFQPLSV